MTTVVTSLTPGTGTAWCDLDEDGQILVGTGWANGGGVFRVDPVMGTYTTPARRRHFRQRLLPGPRHGRRDRGRHSTTSACIA